MPKKEVAIKNVTILSAYLLIVWGFYRCLFKFPDEVEELLIKPIIWLTPLFYFLRKEKLGISSLGFTLKNIFPSIYISLALGAFFVIESVILNYVKYGVTNLSANLGNTSFFAAIILSFATAITEEVTFRGYIFSRVWKVVGDELSANFITSIVWALIHLPVAVFWWELNFSGTIIILLLTTLFGMGSAFVYARTKNIASSIFLHFLWGWPIILFR